MRKSEYRNATLDIAKGMSIILMTLSHLVVFQESSFVKYLNSYLSISKMPLFIIISGILLSMKHDALKFIFNKFDSLMKPTIMIIFLFILIYISYNYLNYGVIGKLKSVNAVVFPLWFISSLFITQVIFYLLVKNKIKSHNYVLIISFLLIIFYYFQYTGLEFFNLIKLHTILSFLIFFGIGFLIKRFNLLSSLISYKIFFISIFAISLPLFFRDDLNIALGLAVGVYGDFLPTLFTALLGFLFFINLSNFFCNSIILIRIFVLFSKSSFFILAFHIVFERFVISLIGFLGYERNILIDSMIFIATISLCILMYFVMKNIPYINSLFFPLKVIGKNKVFLSHRGNREKLLF